MARRKRRIPKAWIVVDKSSHTRAIQNEKTGKMEGRRFVKGIGDRTRVRRISKGEFAGQVLGRTHPVPIRGDKKKRGTIRRRL